MTNQIESGTAGRDAAALSALPLFPGANTLFKLLRVGDRFRFPRTLDTYPLYVKVSARWFALDTDRARKFTTGSRTAVERVARG